MNQLSDLIICFCELSGNDCTCFREDQVQRFGHEMEGTGPNIGRSQMSEGNSNRIELAREAANDSIFCTVITCMGLNIRLELSGQALVGGPICSWISTKAAK